MLRTLPPAAAPIGVRDIISGVCGLLRGQRQINQFRSELKSYFGVKHCFLVSSGKAALTLILLALKELFADRDEVILPAFTCYSVPASVVRAGLRIKLCDLNPESLDFDFIQLSAQLSRLSALPPELDFGNVTTNLLKGMGGDVGYLIGSATGILAVVTTHLFGFPSDVQRLRKLVQDAGVIIVEDAAQAMGEICDRKMLGTLGDISFFSLGRGKAFSSVEGGVILTDRDDIAVIVNRLVESLPHHHLWDQGNLFVKAIALMLFTHPWLFWIPRSIPKLRLGETRYEPDFPILRMSSFQAGLAVRWREKLYNFRHTRKTNVNRWIAALDASKKSDLYFKHSLSLGLLRFPIKIKDSLKRKSLLKESTERGLGIAPVYPDSINHIPELSEHLKSQKFPVAERFAQELVTLPTHVYLTQKDIVETSKLVVTS